MGPIRKRVTVKNICAMLKYFRLVRFKNLLIIAATMVLVRYMLIQTILSGYGLELQMPIWYFVALVLATMLVAAGGYVINDYFDTKADLINRPETVVVGKQVTRRGAIAFHLVLSILGIFLGTVVSFRVGRPVFSLLFFLTAGVLWFYSTTYKRQLFVGNLVVAFLTAMVPLIPLIFEFPLLGTFSDIIFIYQLNMKVIVYWVGGYAFFAFMLTLAREIIKDIEDFEGDTSLGRNTIPVHFGVKTSKLIIATVLSLTLIALLVAFSAYLFKLSVKPFDYVSLVYLVIFIVIPIFILIFSVLLASSKKDYHKASSLCKIIMLLGLIYTLIFRFIVNL